jgi:5'-nucleotidase
VNLLLCNDDGIHSPGLKALEEALGPLGDVWTVAPSKEHSAQSHAFTLHKPLRLHGAGPRRFACSGTPADCAYLGLHGGVPALTAEHGEPPRVVVSGINRGPNLGFDVHYSGTVAAAREAAFSGVPAVAISLYTTGRGALHWETAQHVAARVVARVAREGLPRFGFLNVNVPNVPLSALQGVVVVPMGVRLYSARVDRREDPFGRPYFWLGGEHASFDEDPNTDGRSCERGWATVTPMSVDATDRAALAALAGPGFPALDA